MRVTNNYGVSEVVSLILIVMIATTSIGIVVFWGVPMMESRKVFVRVDSALKQFEDLNDVIKRVSSGGANTSEQIDFVTDAGQIGFGVGERFVLYYSPRATHIFNFDVSGFDYGEDDYDENKFTIINNNKFAPLNWWENYILHIYFLDTHLSEIVDPIPIDGIVTSSSPITGAVRIDILYKTTDELCGRIWVFDTTCISYDVLTPEGTYSVIAENGAVVYASPYSSRVYNTPSLYYKNNSLSTNENSLLVMHITNLKSQGYRSVSGLGRYNFLIKSNSSSIQENRITIPNSFNMTIYGQENIVDAWVRYYKDEDFWLTDNFLPIYLEGPLDFTLVYSVCDVWVG